MTSKNSKQRIVSLFDALPVIRAGMLWQEWEGKRGGQEFCVSYAINSCGEVELQVTRGPATSGCSFSTRLRTPATQSQILSLLADFAQSWASTKVPDAFCVDLHSALTRQLGN